MIIPNELRIGNLFYPIDKNVPAGTPYVTIPIPFKVFSVAMFEVQACKSELTFANVEKMDIFNIFEPRPIILTEDWLLKLGFKKVQQPYFEESKFENFEEFYNGDFDIVKGDGLFYLWFNCGDSWFSDILGNGFMYVHQLQNLYFALTGKNLEIIDEVE